MHRKTYGKRTTLCKVTVKTCSRSFIPEKNGMRDFEWNHVALEKLKRYICKILDIHISGNTVTKFDVTSNECDHICLSRVCLKNHQNQDRHTEVIHYTL